MRARRSARGISHAGDEPEPRATALRKSRSPQPQRSRFHACRRSAGAANVPRTSRKSLGASSDLSCRIRQIGPVARQRGRERATRAGEAAFWIRRLRRGPAWRAIARADDASSASWRRNSISRSARNLAHLAVPRCDESWQRSAHRLELDRVVGSSRSLEDSLSARPAAPPAPPDRARG